MLRSSLAPGAAARSLTDRGWQVTRRWAALRAHLASDAGGRTTAARFQRDDVLTPPILNPHIRREAR